MVLDNASAAQSLNADFHFVPTIHVDDATAPRSRRTPRHAPARPRASRRRTPVTGAGAGDGRLLLDGPALAGGGDLLKPDITAPGVDVIAAVSPAGNNGNIFDAESGTSMSAPHIAGIAALIKSKNPNWSAIR